MKYLIPASFFIIIGCLGVGTAYAGSGGHWKKSSVNNTQVKSSSKAVSKSASNAQAKAIGGSGYGGDSRVTVSDGDTVYYGHGMADLVSSWDCNGSRSGDGGNRHGFLGFAWTTESKDCIRMKDVALLNLIGQPGAAVQRACDSFPVYEAMWRASTIEEPSPCSRRCEFDAKLNIGCQ